MESAAFVLQFKSSTDLIENPLVNTAPFVFVELSVVVAVAVVDMMTKFTGGEVISFTVEGAALAVAVAVFIIFLASGTVILVTGSEEIFWLILF